MKDDYRKDAYVYIHDCGIYAFFLIFIPRNEGTYQLTLRHRLVSLLTLLSELHF